MAAAGVDSGALLSSVAGVAERSGVFGAVSIDGGVLACEARDSAEPATYRVWTQDGGVWVGLVMKDRWQSESIEADLMHTGDKLEELLDEELAELGYDSSAGGVPTYQHFRSEDMLFTFQSPVPLSGLGADEAAERVGQWLLGYEACFRQLGDMESSDED